MFDNKKYITSGVNDRIPQITQLLMWYAIDEARNKNGAWLSASVWFVAGGKRRITYAKSHSSSRKATIQKLHLSYVW